MYGKPGIGMDPNKFVQQMLIQALQAFYNEDYDTGKHFLEQIRSNLPSFMYNLNPNLRSLCKEIVKLVQGGSLVRQHSVTEQDSTSSPIVEESQLSSHEPLSSPFENGNSSPESSSLQNSNQSNSSPLHTTDSPAEQVPSRPAEFIAELTSAVKGQKKKKKKKVEDELKGSMDDLEDFDF